MEIYLPQAATLSRIRFYPREKTMIHFPVPEALTFDDVLLLPAHSDVLPTQANTQTQPTRSKSCANTKFPACPSQKMENWSASSPIEIFASKLASISPSPK